MCILCSAVLYVEAKLHEKDFRAMVTRVEAIWSLTNAVVEMAVEKEKKKREKGTLHLRRVDL